MPGAFPWIEAVAIERVLKNVHWMSRYFATPLEASYDENAHPPRQQRLRNTASSESPASQPARPLVLGVHRFRGGHQMASQSGSGERHRPRSSTSAGRSSRKLLRLAVGIL